MSAFDTAEKWEDPVLKIEQLRQRIQLRLGLVWQHKFALPQVDIYQDPLKLEILDLNGRLRAMAQHVRHLPAGSHEEFRLTQEMESMEIKRFQLLAKLNGHNLEGYNRLPVML